MDPPCSFYLCACRLSIAMSLLLGASVLRQATRLLAGRTALRPAAAVSSAIAAAAQPSVLSSVCLPLTACTLSPLHTTGIRHSQSATHFRHKKQKEYKGRLAKMFAPMKTHAGCKKRFRFVSRWAIVCKHSGKVRYQAEKCRVRANVLANPRQAYWARLRESPHIAWKGRRIESLFHSTTCCLP